MSRLKLAVCLASWCTLKTSLCNATVNESSAGGSEDSCSGFAFSTSNKSGGRLPVAACKRDYPLIANCAFLAQTVIVTACLNFLLPICGREWPLSLEQSHCFFSSISPWCSWSTGYRVVFIELIWEEGFISNNGLWNTLVLGSFHSRRCTNVSFLFLRRSPK